MWEVARGTQVETVPRPVWTGSVLYWIMPTRLSRRESRFDHLMQREIDPYLSAVSSTGSTACGDACTHQNALDAWCLLAKVAPNDANARLKPLVCRETKNQTGLALISPAQPSPHDKRVSSRASRGRSERRSLTYPFPHCGTRTDPYVQRYQRRRRLQRERRRRRRRRPPNAREATDQNSSVTKTRRSLHTGGCGALARVSRSRWSSGLR